MEIKKVSISIKNPENYPIKSFAHLKKITTHIFQKECSIGNFIWVVKEVFHGDRDFFDFFLSI